jgi:hypothetical protein
MNTENRPLDQDAENELKALEAGLAGRPVDAELAEFAELASSLKAGRPTPDPLYTDELDQAVTDGFPPDWSADPERPAGRGFFGRFVERFGGKREALLPLTTAVAGLVVVVVALGVAFNDGRSGSGFDETSQPGFAQGTGNGDSATAAGASASNDSGAEAESAARLQAVPESLGPAAAVPIGATALGAAPGAANRQVARDVKITLATTPEDLQETSNRIVEVSDSFNGIVMRSSVSDGEAGVARARFSLLIPSGKAEEAVAELSAVADLRSRSQGSVDITAPTLTTRDRLQTAEARVDSLLNELAEAASDEERATVERKLRNARLSVAWLTTQLNRLERKVSLTPVTIAIETGQDSGSDVSGWNLGDAIDDAGNLLGISAGVALIALAVAIPIGLMVLIALAINRAWLRRSRDRALRDS